MGERLQDFDTNDVKLGPISSMVVTPDRKQLILTTNSPMVTFLDIGKKILAKRLSPRPDDPCQQAILYPDGKHILLVYPTLKNRFCVWDLRNNEESFTLGEIAAKNVHLLGISPNGKWVVGYQEAERGPVYVWDATTGKLMPPISSINTFLVWGGFSAGGNNITFWEFAGRRSVIQLDERKVIQSGNPKTHPYRAAFSSTGNLVVSLDTTGLLVSEHMEKDDSPPAEIAAVVPRKVETPASGFLKSSVELSDTIGGSRYSSDGKIIFVCTHKGILHLLEATTLEEIAQYRISKNKLLEMVHTAKHAATTTTIPERLYLLDSRRRVYQWDTNLGKTTDEFVFDKMLPNPNQTSYHLVVPPDGSSLVFTSNGNQPHLWSMRAKKETLTPPPWTWMRPPITFSSKNLHRVVFSADEKVGTACAESKLYTWTVPAGGEKAYPLIDSKMTPDWLALIPDTSVLVAAEFSKLEAWNYTTGRHLWSAETAGNMAITGLAAIPKSSGFVTIGDDSTIRVWDSLTGKEVVNWRFGQPALGLAISPDGKYALTQHGQTNQLRMWALPALTAKKP